MHGVKRQEESFAVSSEEEVLHSLVHTTIRDKKEKEFHFRNVMMHPYGAQIDSPFVLEDTLTSVGEEGVLFWALQNHKTPGNRDFTKHAPAWSRNVNSALSNNLSSPEFVSGEEFIEHLARQ